MKSRAPLAVAAALACLLPIGLSGCASPSTVTVGRQATSAAVEPGGELIIDFGEVNGSVGSDWVITSEPDPAVLSPGKKESEYLGEPGSVGGPSQLEYRFAAVGPGMTKIQFEYRFRGEVPDDPAEQETAQITVSVESP